MNVQEVFSDENTAHLSGQEDKQRYLVNVVQLAWFECHPDLSEAESGLLSKWFREDFLPTEEAEALLARFKKEPTSVLETIEELYRASVTKH